MPLLLGLLVGASGLDLLPLAAPDWLEPISFLALTIVAFLLGGELTRKNLMRHGCAILSVSICIVVGTTALVWRGLSVLGMDPHIVLLQGAIATATEPAAIA
jgi:Kef-type K+ transport system membrane component KefB